jgi:hypothetical protein
MGDSDHGNESACPNRADFVVVGITVKQLAHICLGKTRVSEGERIVSSNDFPMAKLTSFE